MLDISIDFERGRGRSERPAPLSQGCFLLSYISKGKYSAIRRLDQMMLIVIKGYVQRSAPGEASEMQPQRRGWFSPSRKQFKSEGSFELSPLAPIVFRLQSTCSYTMPLFFTLTPATGYTSPDLVSRLFGQFSLRCLSDRTSNLLLALLPRHC